MRDYQPNGNMLPRAVWKQCLYMVRDYERLSDEYENAIQDSPQPPDGQPKARSIANQTEREAIKRVQMSIKLRAIENALYCVPEEYRSGVWNNIVKFERYPDYAASKTYKRWKSRFIDELARNMYMI